MLSGSHGPFDTSDPGAEASADARAEADARAGRLISHSAVRRWLESWGSAKPRRGHASAIESRRIVWTDEAVDNLEAIVTYISAFNPAAAARLGERPIAVADSLAKFSERGRHAGEGGREMTVVWPDILRYRIEGETVVILRIRHGGQEQD